MPVPVLNCELKHCEAGRRECEGFRERDAFSARCDIVLGGERVLGCQIAGSPETVDFVNTQRRGVDQGFASGRPMASRMACLLASRPMSANDSVRGMFLGHTRTQFWALPHPAIPSSLKVARSRSDFSKAPVGCALKSRACDIAAGPM